MDGLVVNKGASYSRILINLLIGKINNQDKYVHIPLLAEYAYVWCRGLAHWRGSLSLGDVMYMLDYFLP